MSFFQYELEGGLLTVNEWRASKGLPAWSPEQGGDLTLPQLRAQFPETFAKSTLTQTSGPAADLARGELPAPETPAP